MTILKKKKIRLLLRKNNFFLACNLKNHKLIMRKPYFDIYIDN